MYRGCSKGSICDGVVLGRCGDQGLGLTPAALIHLPALRVEMSRQQLDVQGWGSRGRYESGASHDT